MESLIVSPLLQIVFDKLASPILEDLKTHRGFKKEVGKLQKTLPIIQAVIEDAEERQSKDNQIKIWLEKLKDVVYDAEDFLDVIWPQKMPKCGEFEDEMMLSWRRSQRPSYFRCAQQTRYEVPDFRRFMLQIGNKVRKTSLALASYRNYYKMPYRLKEIRERLDEIVGEMNSFQLKQAAVYKRTDTKERRETGPYINESDVLGRREDEKILVDMLLKSDANNCVITIVGMGGIGKTTLAQLAYRNEGVTSHFDLKMWICVYEFNPRKIMAEMLEYVNKGSNGSISQMGLLQTQLMEALCGKRFLLVLDDMWSDDRDEWEKVRNLLGAGANGSKVIITTRSQKVASITSTSAPYHLNALSEDDCWTLLKKQVFADGEEDAFPHLLPIGKEIAAKCKGFPLAAKVLGCLLHFEREESKWLRLQRSDLWNLDGGENKILSVQKLSFNHLPPHLKRCFTYCAVFPKNYGINKEKLIHQWIAAGLIQSATDVPSCPQQPTLEDIGNNYFNDLLGMSFLEVRRCDVTGTTEFKMHDLIHSLAKSVAGNEFLYLEGTNRLTGPSQQTSMEVAYDALVKNRHALVERNFSSDVVRKLLRDAKKLRSLNILSLADVSENAITSSISSFKHLRILNLSGFGIKKLHKSIGELICLRYLDLSNTPIEELPATICNLWKLQSLDLSGCNNLLQLPERMQTMSDLKHLKIKDCAMLRQLPPYIGRLRNLQTLPLFIVGNAWTQSLKQLAFLCNLQGELKIKHLENETGVYTEVLMNKQLHSLGLTWGDVDEGKQNHQTGGQRREAHYLILNPETVIAMLRPNCFLRKLFINGYKGTRFPRWISEDTLRNLTQLEIINCPRCETFPMLGELPALEVIRIQGMELVSSIRTRSFPSLKELYLRDIPNLREWESMDRVEVFSFLNRLTLINCPHLISMPWIPSLRHLEMRNCNALMLRSAAELESLFTLVIDNFPELEFIPKVLSRNKPLLMSLSVCSCPILGSMPDFGELGALKTLRIGWCEGLRSFPQGLSNLTSLETIEIIECPKLISSSGESIEGLISLRSLSIENCDGFSCLPISMQQSTALERLTIMYCSNLVSLPDDMQHLSVLKSLTILSCGELASLPEGLQFVTTLQNLEIRSCPKLLEMPDWVGNLISLRSLTISDCHNIKTLPQSIQRLTTIQHLTIRDCPDLEERCKRGMGEDWEKISHIPYFYLGSS